MWTFGEIYGKFLSKLRAVCVVLAVDVMEVFAAL